MVITKSHLKSEIDSMDDQYLEVLYQLIKKLPMQQNMIHKLNFKAFLLNIPNIEGFEVERQRDYPKDVVL